MCRFPVLLTIVLVGIVLCSTAKAEDTPAPAESSPYEKTLATYVDEGGWVDYASLKTNRTDLDAYVAWLGSLSPKTFGAWSESERIALLINAYNAFTLKAIIDHYPIQSSWLKSLKYPKNSIQQIGDQWSAKRYTLMGSKVSLEQIEHEMLRKDYSEPRIHMAINCASVGCPALSDKPFTGEQLDEQLAAQSRRFFANPIKFKIDRKAKRVYLSLIFDWFGEDFAKGYTPKSGFSGQSKALKPVLNFIAQNVNDADAAYLRTGGYSVKWLDYDWALNEQTK